MSLRWWSSCRTNSGRLRKTNEDAYLDMQELGLWMVADGMGGHAKGDMASRVIIDSFNDLPKPRSLEEFSSQVKERLNRANDRVQQVAIQTGSHQMMGSTVVALMVFKGQCACLWAGDSRAYLLRDGKLTQITRDHNIAEELVRRGELTREQAIRHPTANRITRAIGTQNTLNLDETRCSLQDGDTVLLCSDGLNKEVTDEEIQDVLGNYDCQEASLELMDLSLERGARDNVTVAVVRFEVTTGFGDSALENTLVNDSMLGRRLEAQRHQRTVRRWSIPPG